MEFFAGRSNTASRCSNFGDPCQCRFQLPDQRQQRQDEVILLRVAEFAEVDPVRHTEPVTASTMILQSDNRRLRAGPARRGATKVSNYVPPDLHQVKPRHFLPSHTG